MTIDDTIASLETVGWLGSLPDKKRKTLRSDLETWYQRNPSWAYFGLATAEYDTEAIEDDGDYATVVRVYRRASGQRFDPQALKSKLDHEAERAALQFTVGGRVFERAFSLDIGDYVSPDLEPFLNEALEQCGFQERFFTLPMIDTVARVVFVPTAVYESAVAAGVVPSTAPPR